MLAHYPTMAGNPGQQQIYEALRGESFWPYMANDIYDTENQCGPYARNQNHYQHKRPLQLFPASEHLKRVATDIIGLHPKTTSGNKYVLAITDCYLEPTRAIPSSKTTSTPIANTIFDQWTILYGTSSFSLTDNGSQLTSKFFAALCALLSVKHLTKTACHLQTNDRAKRLSKMVVTRF